jgi:pumilio homology domain family member 6
MANDLHKLLNEKNNYCQLALAHDTSRIIQWMMKFGSEKVREEASKALMDIIVEMIQSKYARNTVKRILKYGSANVRSAVISALFGNILKLASHTWSAPILDYIYTEVATKKQRQQLKQEFYGDIYKKTKDEKVTNLRDTFKDTPEMKTAMLGATKANLTRVLNKNVHDCG